MRHLRIVAHRKFCVRKASSRSERNHSVDFVVQLRSVVHGHVKNTATHRVADVAHRGRTSVFEDVLDARGHVVFANLVVAAKKWVIRLKDDKFALRLFT